MTQAVERSWRAPLAVRVAERKAAWWRQRDEAAAEVEAIGLDNRARPVHARMSDIELNDLAQRRAELMQDQIGARGTSTPEALRAWLDAEVLRLGGYVFDDKAELTDILPRVQDGIWWRRPLKRQQVRMREAEGIAGGEVCARRQVYCTDDTVRRHLRRAKAARAMLARTEIEADDGEVMTLLDAVETSTSHKPIRRAELMTRIRGTEEAAQALGMVGLFTTNTAPSRYHSTSVDGRRNPKWDGSMPDDAQRWQCDTWRRTRAALGRQRVKFMGWRVAEPHHDGCPHWHMLIFCKRADVETLRETMRRYWLEDEGTERGAAEHRFKCKDLEHGNAAGYIAKYIAKNIDDVGAVGTEGHRDDIEGEQVAIRGTAQRVEAWASAWGIRQFQPLGQPSVTVWRELRRVDEQNRKGGSDALQAAFAAVHRTDSTRADWFGYMRAQGGPMLGRDYRIKLLTREEQREGRYGVTEEQRPIGVYDARRPSEHVLSSRREWKPRGTWRTDQRQPWAPLLGVDLRRAQPAAPWTRFNNCTRAGGAAFLMSTLKARNAPELSTFFDLSGTGGGSNPESDHDRTRFHPPDPGSHRGRVSSDHR